MSLSPHTQSPVENFFASDAARSCYQGLGEVCSATKNASCILQSAAIVCLAGAQEPDRQDGRQKDDA